MVSEKIFSCFGGEELSLYFQITNKITQHLSYDTMTKLTSSNMKVATAAKKKSGKWDRAPYFYCIVLFLSLTWVFSVLAPLFYHFFDKQHCCNARVECVIGPCFLCCYCLASTKKGVPSSPTILVGSAASTLMTTNSSSTKALMMSSSLSLIVKAAQQQLLGSLMLSTKLPPYRINWLSIDDIRCKLKKYSNEDKTRKKPRKTYHPCSPNSLLVK